MDILEEGFGIAITSMHGILEGGSDTNWEVLDVKGIASLGVVHIQIKKLTA